MAGPSLMSTKYSLCCFVWHEFPSSSCVCYNVASFTTCVFFRTRRGTKSYFSLFSDDVFIFSFPDRISLDAPIEGWEPIKCCVNLRQCAGIFN